MSSLNYGLIKRSTTCYLKVVWRPNNPICVRQDMIFYTVCGDFSNYVLWSSLKDSGFLFYLTLQVSIQQDIHSPEVDKMGKLGSESHNSASNRGHCRGWGAPFEFSHCTKEERKRWVQILIRPWRCSSELTVVQCKGVLSTSPKPNLSWRWALQSIISCF